MGVTVVLNCVYRKEGDSFVSNVRCVSHVHKWEVDKMAYNFSNVMYAQLFLVLSSVKNKLAKI